MVNNQGFAVFIKFNVATYSKKIFVVFWRRKRKSIEQHVPVVGKKSVSIGNFKISP